MLLNQFSSTFIYLCTKCFVQNHTSRDSAILSLETGYTTRVDTTTSLYKYTWLIHPSPTPSSISQTRSQAPPKSSLIQTPSNKHQLPLLLTLPPLASVQIHNLKHLPHALYHLDSAGGGEEAAFESVDRECKRFGSVMVTGLREEGFPEDGAEPGFKR